MKKIINLRTVFSLTGVVTDPLEFPVDLTQPLEPQRELVKDHYWECGKFSASVMPLITGLVDELFSDKRRDQWLTHPGDAVQIFPANGDGKSFLSYVAIEEGNS